MPGKQAKVVTPPMLQAHAAPRSRSSHPARDRAMILLSVKAGLRACEIAGLDWSMPLTRRVARPARSTFATSSRRSAAGRRIPMHPDLRRALERLALTVSRSGR